LSRRYGKELQARLGIRESRRHARHARHAS
jgi:hypothetical protein